jgi:peptidoglycan/xylan/chitin deacetylase (PgdA/CDA1 family)
MRIVNKQILRRIFSLKGNFAAGVPAPKRLFGDVEIAPFRNACSAAVSISADFELNWAYRGRASHLRDSLGTTERKNVPYILDLLSDFSMPITWATVGHLFLTSCTRDGEHAHRNMPRPPRNTRWQGDWYKHDPCTDVVHDPLWYAPDLIEQVMRAKVAHEIGSHSFSHIDFSSQTSDSGLVKREIEECRAASESYGLQLRSLVYPFNNMGHVYHDLLYQYGIIAVRHRDAKIRLSYPERTPAGVYKLYESMNLRSTDHYHYRDKAQLFIAHAVEQGAAFHLWFHPSDPRSVFEKEFTDILEIIRQLRAAGSVWTATMGDLASYCEARESTTVRSRSERNTTILEVQSAIDKEKYGIPELTLTIPAQTAPKSIRCNIDGTRKELRPELISSYRNGRLILNVLAANQTITLTF